MGQDVAQVPRRVAAGVRARLGVLTSRAARREIALVVVGYTVYSLIRNAAPAERPEAVAHGLQVVAFEERTGLAVEHPLNAFFDAHAALAVAANYFYATVFSISAVATLVLLFVLDRRLYAFHRSVLFTMTAGAMVTYWLYPLVPPRLLPGGGFVDTFVKYHTWGRLYVDSGTAISNQYAAMPSMHTGWSIWVAVSLCTLASRWWQRALACCLPVVTVLVIMGTANHYLVDALAGAFYYAVALTLVTVVLRVRAHLEQTGLGAAPARRRATVRVRD